MKEFTQMKIVTALGESSQGKFGFTGTKFGKVYQYDVYKQKLFNLWHIVTPGRVITSIFCAKIINPEHQEHEMYSDTLLLSTNQGEIHQYSIPNTTITDHKLLHEFISANENQPEIVDLDGTSDGKKFWSCD